MKLNQQSSKGFTLVEIMIVVVIIGLLAAMAIPAFQKVRQNSINNRMDNDARQVASAAQQYFLEYSATTVPFTYTASTGAVTSVLSSWVKQLGTQYSSVPSALTMSANFTFNHPLGSGVRTYSPEGQKQ